jgi:hypothetical protein
MQTNKNKNHKQRTDFSKNNYFVSFLTSFQLLRSSLLVNLLILCFFVQPNLSIIVSAKNSGNLPFASEKNSLKHISESVNHSSGNIDVNVKNSPNENLKFSSYLGSLFSLFGTEEENIEVIPPTNLPIPTPEPKAIVRKGFTLNSARIEGSVQQLNAESTILNGGAVITGDLLIPGIPSVILNGTPTFGGVITGTGTAIPTSHGDSNFT